MIRTHQEVREEFARKGISYTSWAVLHGFSPNLVYEVIKGNRKCLRGQSHKIAVLLGLKKGVVSDTDPISDQIVA
nr:MAG TPA: hypothetical protein [Caudoviricetes sp.]